MTTILEHVWVWVGQVIMTLDLVGIALVMFIENMFPPLPTELIMPLAGFLASRGFLSFPAVVIAGTVGSVLGTLPIYFIGARVGEERVRGWVRRYGRYLLISERDLDRSLKVFNRYGPVIVMVARLLPALRGLISLPAGLNRMNLALYLLFTTIGAGAWNFLMAYAGVLLGRNWQMVTELTDRYEILFWSILGLLVVVFLVRRLRRFHSGSWQKEHHKSRR